MKIATGFFQPPLGQQSGQELGLRERARVAVQQEPRRRSLPGIGGFATIGLIRSSPTSPPAAMIALAARPSSVPALTSPRSTSPVEIAGIPNRLVMNAALGAFAASRRSKKEKRSRWTSAHPRPHRAMASE